MDPHFESDGSEFVFFQSIGSFVAVDLLSDRSENFGSAVCLGQIADLSMRRPLSVVGRLFLAFVVVGRISSVGEKNRRLGRTASAAGLFISGVDPVGGPTTTTIWFEYVCLIGVHIDHSIGW